MLSNIRVVSHSCNIICEDLTRKESSCWHKYYIHTSLFTSAKSLERIFRHYPFEENSCLVFGSFFLETFCPSFLYTNCKGSNDLLMEIKDPLSVPENLRYWDAIQGLLAPKSGALRISA